MTHQLFEAIRNEDSKSVKSVLETHPHLVNVKDARGSTPLLLSIYFGFKEVSEIILQYPQHIDAQDASGNTALMGVVLKATISL